MLTTIKNIKEHKNRGLCSLHASKSGFNVNAKWPFIKREGNYHHMVECLILTIVKKVTDDNKLGSSLASESNSFGCKSPKDICTLAMNQEWKVSWLPTKSCDNRQFCESVVSVMSVVWPNPVLETRLTLVILLLNVHSAK